MVTVARSLCDCADAFGRHPGSLMLELQRGAPYESRHIGPGDFASFIDCSDSNHVVMVHPFGSFLVRCRPQKYAAGANLHLEPSEHGHAGSDFCYDLLLRYAPIVDPIPYTFISVGLDPAPSPASCHETWQFSIPNQSSSQRDRSERIRAVRCVLRV